ncbi:MarR family winged helix-turn-helix transcriptional regulator [Streptomyces zagrosensis]|uniref:DNA-binding MarR family transcriptional regulator n=1 Tax=Streptomyces zagrosensis TaxID=1042984 RepID=A0A7W9Q7R7_9ACTN|nr:MarR family transcriptional regulator [Streptomyces zagrosensis]MBB5934287.1 DNA-binding MarR family transcriptional regulator [Streptomyces zagrosensis]
MATQEQYRELARQLTATAAIQRDLSRALPADCPPASAIVLMVLARHGEIRMSKLAELLSIDMSVTSRHAAHVAERGWIDRQPDPLDKRSRLLRINARGEALLNQVAEGYSHVLAHCLSGWSDDELGQLNTLLAKLRASFGDCRARPPLPPQVSPAATPTPPAAPADPHPPPSVGHDITRTRTKR